MKKRNRLLSMVLALVMLIGLLPASTLTAFAEKSTAASTSTPATIRYVRVNSLDEIVPNARYIIAGVWTDAEGNDSYHLMGKDYRTNGGFHYSYAQDQSDVHYFDISEDLSTIDAVNYSSILKVRLRPNGYYPDSYYFMVDNGDGTESYLCGWSTSTNQGSTGHDAHSCMPIYKNSYNTCGDAWWYLRMPTEGDYAGEWQIVSRCKFRKGGTSTYEYDIMQLRTPYPNSAGQFRAEEVYTRDVGEIEDSERIKYTVDTDTNIMLFREVCTHISTDVTHVEPKLPTCTTPGNIEYWFCKGCETFSNTADLSGTIGIADVFVAPTSHNGECGHGAVTKKFELYADSSFSSNMHGDDFILIGKSGDKYYAMGNTTNADGSRNAVEVTRDENGIITENSDRAEFLTYNFEDTPSGFTADGGVFSVLDGKILSYDRSFYRTSGYVPEAARFSVDDYETGLGSFFAYSSRDTKNEYIVFDAESLTFKAQNTKSDTTYIYRQLCGHEKMHYPKNSSTCTRCGNVEYWYCDTCWEYYGAEDASIKLDWGQLNSHATGHNYVDGACANCSKKVPVYTKVTSEDQLGQSGTYIVVATDGTNTYVLKEPINLEADLDGNGIWDAEEKDENGNEIPDIYEIDTNGNEIPDIDEWDFVDPAIPVTPNQDGTISVFGLGAAEFEMIKREEHGYDEEFPVEYSAGEEAESDKYYLYLINGFLNGMNKPNTRFDCFINGEEYHGGDETNTWGISLGNGLTAQEQRELGPANFEIKDDTAVMYTEFVGNGATGALRLRKYNGQTQFITEYDGYLPGAVEKLDENGEHYYDENGYYYYETNDSQFGVHLYFAPDEYSHIHSWSEWEKADDDNHTRTCSAEGCKVKTETRPHTWDSGRDVKAPTCTEKGEKIYTCIDCKATKTEEISETGHDWDEWNYTDADSHSRVCKNNCGVESEKEVHQWGKWISADEKEHKKTCSVCNGTVSESHKWDEGTVTKEPTDLAEGVRTYTCSDCAQTKIEAIPKLPHTHRFGEWAPTAGDDTTHTRVCPCEATETEAHTFDEGVVIQAATHIAPGQKVYTCSVCGFSYDETIPTLTDHEWGDWQVNPQDETSHVRTCPCGETEIKQHAYGVPVATKEPTAEAEGEKTYTCTDCGHVKTETIEKIVPIAPAEEITTEDKSASLKVPEGSEATVDEKAILVVDSCSEDEKKDLVEKTEENLVSVVGEGKEIVVGYDVSLLMGDVPVQPGGKVLITLPYMAKDFPYTDLVVVYIDDDGNVVTCETIITEDGYVAFYTDHFSTYAVVGKQTYTPGDVDDIPGVTTDDAIYVLFAVNFPESYPVSQPLDFDGNGVVDTDDAIYLLFYVNFPESYPLH